MNKLITYKVKEDTKLQIESVSHAEIHFNSHGIIYPLFNLIHFPLSTEIHSRILRPLIDGLTETVRNK